MTTEFDISEKDVVESCQIRDQIEKAILYLLNNMSTMGRFGEWGLDILKIVEREAKEVNGLIQSINTDRGSQF